MTQNSFLSLETALQATDVNEQFSSALLTAIRTDKDFVERFPPESSFGAIVGRYVVRDDDVDGIAIICDAIETAASVGFFVGNASADAILAAKVSLAISLVKLMYSLGSKGALVTPEELRLLLAIRASDEGEGVTLSQLSKALGDEPSDLKEILSRLSAYPVRSSVTKAFVESHGDAWRVAV